MKDYSELSARELWKKISNEIIFFDMPIYAIYDDDFIKYGLAKLPVITDVKNEAPLTQLRTVGRTVLDLAKLSYNGVELYMSNRDDVVKMMNMLDAFLIKQSHMVRLANSKSVNEEDLEAVIYLAESLGDRHKKKYTEKRMEEVDEIKAIFSPKRGKGKVKIIRRN